MSTNSTEQRSSRKKTFIIIAAAACLLFGLAVVVIGAAVGIYVYTSRPGGPLPPERTFDPPGDLANRKPGPRDADPTRQGTRSSSDAMINEMRKHRKVGEYKLQNFLASRGKKTFPNADAEVRGIFTDKANTINFLIAEYGSATAAATNFGRMLGDAKGSGAKVVKEMRVKDGMIDAGFENGKIKTIAYCLLSQTPPIACHMISSESKTALIEFSDAYWGTKK